MASARRASSVDIRRAEARHAEADEQRLDALAHPVQLLALGEAERDTQAPVFATTVTRPSASSIRIASRTGTRLAPYSLGEVLLPDARPGRVLARRGSPRAARPRSARRRPRGPTCRVPSRSRCTVITPPGRAGCHSRTAASASYALPSGKLTSSNCMPHGAQEVHPALPVARVATRHGLAHHLDAARAQVGDRRVEVVDVDRQVVPADVAVARLTAPGRRPVRTGTPRGSCRCRGGRTAARA